MSAVDKFPILLSDAEEESSAVPPCFSDEGINVCKIQAAHKPLVRLSLHAVRQFLYIRHNNLYLLALTKRNSNAAEILLFLHKIVEVFTEYFKELEEESIRDNFVIIYELLDEMMDFGYPQTTETKILQEYGYHLRRKSERQADYCHQVHHTRVTQARSTGTTTNSSHKCSILAIRRHTVSEE